MAIIFRVAPTTLNYMEAPHSAKEVLQGLQRSSTTSRVKEQIKSKSGQARKLCTLKSGFEIGVAQNNAASHKFRQNIRCEF